MILLFLFTSIGLFVFLAILLICSFASELHVCSLLLSCFPKIHVSHS